MSTESPPTDPVAATRAWLLQHQVATLSTTSVQRGLEGYPYASVAPFALDPAGRPVILISTLAAHTKNLQADPRGALLVRQPDTGPDPQIGWRVSLIGDWEKVPRGTPERSHLHARYLQRVPGGERYDALGDFDYWRMSTVQKVRYIGGFGKITWLRGDAVRPAADEAWSDAAASAVAHMNEDHAENLVEMCQGFYGIAPTRATLTALDRDGFVVRTEGPDRDLFFAFGRDLAAGDLRVAMIQVLKDARSQA
ncbi:MAG: DUF2470 domain-containing protein [Myxococcota bacterium]